MNLKYNFTIYIDDYDSKWRGEIGYWPQSGPTFFVLTNGLNPDIREKKLLGMAIEQTQGFVKRMIAELEAMG